MSLRSVPPERLGLLPTGEQGLGAAEVAARRLQGFNDIMAPAASGWRVVARDTLRDPMLWFLLLTAGLFGLLGQAAESLTLLLALVPLLGMDAYLHRRTSASSAGLASRLATPHACCAMASGRRCRPGNWCRATWPRWRRASTFPPTACW